MRSLQLLPLNINGYNNILTTWICMLMAYYIYNFPHHLDYILNIFIWTSLEATTTYNNLTI